MPLLPGLKAVLLAFSGSPQKAHVVVPSYHRELLVQSGVPHSTFHTASHPPSSPAYSSTGISLESNLPTKPVVMQSAEGRDPRKPCLWFLDSPQNNQRTGCERHGLIMTYAMASAIVSHHSDFPNTRFYGKTGPAGGGGCANAHRPHQLRVLKTASCFL